MPAHMWVHEQSVNRSVCPHPEDHKTTSECECGEYITVCCSCTRIAVTNKACCRRAAQELADRNGILEPKFVFEGGRRVK